MSAVVGALHRAKGSRLLQRPAALRARDWARRKRNIHDSVAVRQFRALVRQLRTDPPDLIWLGDSMSVWTHPADRDPRNQMQMIKDALGPDVKMFTTWGASYGATIHAAYLRALQTTDHRPVLLSCTWNRGCTVGWTEHPVFGHKRSVAAMHAIDPTGPLGKMRLRLDPPEPEEWEAFYRLPFPTLLDAHGTVGDYAPKLRDLTRWSDDDPERLKLLYAYHYGASIEGTVGLTNYTRMAEAFRATGCPTVIYQVPIPVPWAEQFLGPEVRRLTEANLARIDAAYLAGDPDQHIVQSGMAMAEGEHLDIVDSSEHLKDIGRQRLLDMILPHLQDALERRR